MKRQLVLVLAGLLTSAIGCRKADETGINEKLDRINTRLDAIDHKLDQVAQGRGAQAPRERPPEPDASAVYSVPITGDFPDGPATAKVTIVEAADFA